MLPTILLFPDIENNIAIIGIQLGTDRIHNLTFGVGEGLFYLNEKYFMYVFVEIYFSKNIRVFLSLLLLLICSNAKRRNEKCISIPCHNEKFQRLCGWLAAW